MPTIEHAIAHLMASSIQAGGPGSGRKPKWQPDSPNHAKLNSLHDELYQDGYKWSHSGMNHPDDPKGTSRHTYKKKMGKGLEKFKQISESKTGNHSIRK